MPTLSLLTILLMAAAPSPHDLVGHWEGSLVCRELTYEARFDIAYENDVLHATIDLPEYLILGCPVELTIEGTEVVMRPAFIDGSLRGTFTDDAFVGTGNILVPESSVVLERRGKIPIRLDQEEVRFRSGDAELVGTLVSPPGEGPFPVIVWTHGSGPDTRSTFYYHGRATLLARHGVAGFIYDKRGSGASTGNGAWKLDVLVGDAIAAVEMLATRQDIDDDRIGIAGFSQGGWVAPDVARKCPKIDFVLVGAAPGITVGEQNAFVALNALQSEGYDASDAHDASELLLLIYRFYQTGNNRSDVVRALEAARIKARFDEPVLQSMLFLPNNELPVGVHPYWRPFEPDPEEIWRGVQVPVLSLWGALDRQVPAERSRTVIRQALAQGENPDVTLVIFPNASHGLWVVRDEDAPWDWPRQTPDCASVILKWVLARTRTNVCEADESPAYALRGVSVVDPRGGGSIDENQTVVIEGRTIRVVGPTDLTPIPDDMNIIDGRGLFAVAGLSDLHTHLEEDDLGLFLANGVTTVLEMNGTPAVLGWRREVANGKRLGPTIFTSGPLIAGSEQRWRHVMVTSADEAAAEARRQAEAGYDFLKVYDGLSSEAYSAIAAVSDKRGLPVVGHIPVEVGLNAVVDRRQHSIEHVEQLANAVHLGTHESRIRVIVAQLKGKGIAVTPTLAAMEFLSAVGKPRFEKSLDHAEMTYATRAAREWWADLLRLRVPPVSPDEITFLRTLTLSLAEADVPILVGTDTPNPFLVPGFSLHHEMAALVRAGLRSSVVLEAATIGAATHLGSDHKVGLVETGYCADIVLVSGNPLQNLETLRQPYAVIVRGRWLSASDLDALLAVVAKRRQAPSDAGPAR